MSETRLITAALPYINNVPHMGHIVGCHLPADIFFIYSRSRGHDTEFIGGSDEHGTPSVMAARALGLSTKAFADQLHKIHKNVYEALHLDYSIYSRTSNASDHEMTREFFEGVKKNGFIEKKSEVQFFVRGKVCFFQIGLLKGLVLAVALNMQMVISVKSAQQYLKHVSLLMQNVLLVVSTHRLRRVNIFIYLWSNLRTVLILG